MQVFLKICIKQWNRNTLGVSLLSRRVMSPKRLKLLLKSVNLDDINLICALCFMVNAKKSVNLWVGIILSHSRCTGLLKSIPIFKLPRTSDSRSFGRMRVWSLTPLCCLPRLLFTSLFLLPSPCSLFTISHYIFHLSPTLSYSHPSCSSDLVTSSPSQPLPFLFNPLTSPSCTFLLLTFCLGRGKLPLPSPVWNVRVRRGVLPEVSRSRSPCRQINLWLPSLLLLRLTFVTSFRLLAWLFHLEV